MMITVLLVRAGVKNHTVLQYPSVNYVYNLHQDYDNG